MLQVVHLVGLILRVVAAVVSEFRVMPAGDIRRSTPASGNCRCPDLGAAAADRAVERAGRQREEGAARKLVDARRHARRRPPCRRFRSTRGMSIGFGVLAMLRRVVVLVVTLRPASSRILFVSGFVHVTCCRRFGLRLHRPPRLGRREDRHDASARVLAEVLLVPEDVELVLLRRLPRDAARSRSARCCVYSTRSWLRSGW